MVTIPQTYIIIVTVIIACHQLLILHHCKFEWYIDKQVDIGENANGSLWSSNVLVKQILASGWYVSLN